MEYNVADSNPLHPRGFYTLKSAPFLHHIIYFWDADIIWPSPSGLLEKGVFDAYTHTHTHNRSLQKQALFLQPIESYFSGFTFYHFTRNSNAGNHLRTENSIAAYSVFLLVRSYHPLAKVLAETSLLFQPRFSHYIIIIPVWAVRTTESN